MPANLGQVKDKSRDQKTAANAHSTGGGISMPAVSVMQRLLDPKQKELLKFIYPKPEESYEEGLSLLQEARLMNIASEDLKQYLIDTNWPLERAAQIALSHEAKFHKQTGYISSSAPVAVEKKSKLRKVLAEARSTEDSIDTFTIEDKWFLDNFTLFPGLDWSLTYLFKKEESEIEATKKELFAQQVYNYKSNSLYVRNEFLNRYEIEALEVNRKNPTKKQITTDPGIALKEIDVMHPHTKAEASLIVNIDNLNTSFNLSIAKVLDSITFLAQKAEAAAAGLPGEAMDVQRAGGLVAKHSIAFREMLKLRGSKGIMIRPAGEHSVGLLEKDYAAKPLWIKGKTIDLSKLSLPQLNTLRRYIISKDQRLQGQLEWKSESKEELATKMAMVIAQGLIPMDQLLSKWLRSIEIGKKIAPSDLEGTTLPLGSAAEAPHVSNEVSSKKPIGIHTVTKVRALAQKLMRRQINKIEAAAEAANLPIEEMGETGLIAAMDKDAQKISGSEGHGGIQDGYVASPVERSKPYTGDYDLYSIARQQSQSDSTRELTNMKRTAHSLMAPLAPEKIGSHSEQTIANAYRPMAEIKTVGQPDPKSVHKLFGNISPYEIGMMIDLNAAAATWGGYKGGQVIKHGAESGNFQFPQDISDGIVSIGPDHVSFDKDTKDDVNGYNFTLVLAKLACKLQKKVDYPINPTLDHLYVRIAKDTNWIAAANDQALFVGETVNLGKVREKVDSFSPLKPSLDRFRFEVEEKKERKKMEEEANIERKKIEELAKKTKPA